jgi:hypothetical protein
LVTDALPAPPEPLLAGGVVAVVLELALVLALADAELELVLLLLLPQPAAMSPVASSATNPTHPVRAFLVTVSSSSREVSMRSDGRFGAVGGTP